MEHIIDEDNSYSDDEVNKDLLDLFIAPLNEENVNFALLDDLIEFNPREFKFFSPVLLRTAIFQFVGSTQVLEFLLDHGADPNQQHEGKHCLVQAAKSGSKVVVELLLERGADPEASNFQAYPDLIAGSFSSHDYDASAESVAIDEGLHDIAKIIHKAKHRKPSNDYRIVTQLIRDILEQDSDVGTRARDDRVHMLIDSRNPCISCEDEQGCTLVEALYRRSGAESLRMLSSADQNVKLRDDKALQLMFSEKFDAATFQILIESAPAMIGDINPTFEVPLVQHLVQKGHSDRLACLLSLLEGIAKTENNVPTDITEAHYDKTTILHIACETGNSTIIRRLVQSLSLLGESKKCQNKLQDVINYVDISRKAQKECKQVCLQILIRHQDIRPNERLDLIRLLLDNGANPNIKFGFHELTKDSNLDTMSLLLCAAEAGDERLAITQLLMDYNAKDKGQNGLKSVIFAVDTDLSDVIFGNTWPATSDAGNQNYPNNAKTGVPCSELVHELKRELSKFGYHKSSLADHKVMFHRIQHPTYVYQNTTQDSFTRIRRKSAQTVSFTLEPLSVNYNGVEVNKKIDKELVIKSVLHYYRKSNEFQYYFQQIKVVSTQLLTDLITTVKIENCSNFDNIDERFFTEFKSLNYFAVTDNPMLKNLPMSLSAENSPIEVLLLDRNRIAQVPSWLFGMKKLRTLSISANLFSDLPAEMWTAHSLVDLNISKNMNLRRLPEKNLTCFGVGCDITRKEKKRSLRLSRSSRSSSSEGSRDSKSASLQEEKSGEESSTSESIDFDILSSDRFQSTSSKPKYQRISFFEKHYQAASDVRPQQNFCFDEGELTFGLRLHTLTIREGALEELPKNLACLAPRLHYLYCERNRIKEISIPEQFPPTIMGLTFDSNEITRIHALQKADIYCMRSNEGSIAEEESVISFSREDAPVYQQNISRCKHTRHQRLESLQHLELSHNKGIKYADFDYLEVRGSAVYPATSLPALRNLHMNDCDLSEISDSITRLKNLSWYQVSGNSNIHTIPEDLALLDKLQTFSFEGCQIADEVLKLRSDKGSAKNIQRYLSAKREGKSAWRRMKLMFMGESNAGKTSLVRALARSGQGICSNKYAGVMRYAIRQHHDMEKLEQERKGMPELSTVGVDLNDWFYPKDNSDPKMPPIWFDTWDFAGQEVYQITHQYFISRRCLYLLVFNTVECTNEGYKVRQFASLRQELKKWLNNIYCRIPNANFILVGTRMDIAKDKRTEGFQPMYFEMMEKYLKGEFKQPNDESRKQTSGFPIVQDVIFVTCKEGKDQNNIVALCKQIWKRASEIKSEATGADKNQNLIDIEVPKKYKEVEGWIKQLREDLKERNQEPILSGAKLREEINQHLRNRKVRGIDTAEFGTMMNFMHENGIILHYESTLLNDKYFVDPQWMADQLAEVITVKENQNYGTNLDPGIARINDFLQWISKIAAVSKFKTWPCLFIPLLSQFEVALKFSDNYMLIPSSLPTEREYSERRLNQRSNDIPTSSVMIPEQSGLQAVSTFQPNQKRIRRGIYRKHYKSFSKYEILKGTPPHVGDLVDTDRSILQIWFPEADDVRSLSKFMVFSYIPFGFWARLIARIISDEQFSLTAGDILQPEFKTNQENQFSPVLDYALNSGFNWRCWKTGVALFLWDYIPILEVKEVLSEEQCRKSSPFSQRHETVKIRKHELVNAQGHMARTLNIDNMANYMSAVEFRDEKLKKSFPKQVLSIKVFTNTALIIENRKFHNYALSYDTYFGPNIRNLAHFFEQIAQHVDMLLAEWYPNLGERPQMGFDSDYDHSIERIIPCPKCLALHDPTALPVSRLHLQFSLENIKRHGDRKKTQAMLKQAAEKKNQKPNNRDNSGSSSEDEGSYPKKTFPFKIESMDTDATPTVEDKRISFTKQKSVDFGDFGTTSNFSRQRSGTARQSPDNENQTIEHFMRRYTTAIGADDSFDYSRDWREFHGMEPLPSESQSRLEIPRGDFADGSLSTIGSYDSSPRTSIAPSFRHTMSMREQGRSTRADTSFQKLHCFVEEDILLLACSGQAYLCCPEPEHKEFAIDEVAPNFLFIDMPQDKVLPSRSVEIERYLGQGCFGAVFSGFISDPQERMDDRIPVAHKFYQPINVEERFQAPLGDKEAINSKQKQWMFEPSYSIAEAYTELRKEASVLMELQHEFIVSFYGVSLSPIALILDKAPKGDLAEQLDKFKTENSLLPPPVIKDIIYQLSSALAYLHKHSYVHRDLKPANVLVWKFPEAQVTMKELSGRQPVLVRLSDYGMTQKEISDQMLGRPGTPQYMAPEILQEDGREIFNNKIDIYSLGMIIYDCICLTPPWLSVNFLDFRTMVGENKRPMTTTAAKQSPVAFLDLMCYCSLPDPKRRPNAMELVELLQEQEVCKLIEIVEIRTPQHFQVTNMGLSLVAGDGSPQAMNTIAITSLASVTPFRKSKQQASRNNLQVLDVTLLFYKDILRETINLQFDMSEISQDEIVTSVCCVYKTIWVGTHSEYTMDESLRVFQIAEGKLEEKACNSLESRITDIHHLVIDGPNGKFSCVAVVTENGQINLYKHQWEIHKEAGHNEMRPMRIATLEESGFTQINGLCLVIGRFELSRIPSISTLSNNAPKSPGSPRDHVKTLRIPQNLELWISGDKGNLRRFKILRTADGCCASNDGLLLCFQYVNPVLRHDPENLFQGRLRVDKLLALDSCRRVWTAGAESRNVYMWNVDNHCCKVIPCSNFFDDSRETELRRSSSGDDMLSVRSSSRESHGFDLVVNAVDLKNVNNCVYVALNNGFIIVFDGKSGDQVNQFQSHTVDLCKMLPLDPIIAPPSSQVMEHYQDSFRKKDARYLTFGTGHTSLVELKHDATSETDWHRPRRAETFGPDVFDEMDSMPAKNVLIKLWNQYGEELHKIKKRKPNLEKQDTVTISNNTSSKNCHLEPRVITPDLETEPSMRAVLIPTEFQEATAGLSPKERNQFLHILRFDEAATENLANATPSDDDRGNDEQSLPRSDVSRNNSLTRPAALNLSFHRNSNKKRKANKKMPNGSATTTLPETKSVLIEVKESGFACHRFTLAAGGQDVEFTNGVKVKFQPSSVDLSTSRIITIIVSNPKMNFPKSKQEFSYTSIVTILCEPKRDFHSEVSVTIPLVPRQDLETHTNVYTGFDLMPDNIFPVESIEQFTLDENNIEYRSNRFFLPIVAVSASAITQLPVTLNLHTIFPEQLHILLVYFKESSGQNSLHFSCLSMSRFLGVIRMMPLTNVQFHDIQLLYTLGARIEITAFSRTIYLDVSQNEIVVITDDKSQSSVRPKQNQIDYRFSVISPLNKNVEGFQQTYTYGRINVSSEINDQIIQRAVQRSIQSTNKKWVDLMTKFSFDDGNINDLIKHDNGEIIRRLSQFMTLEELQSVLKTLSSDQDMDFEKRNITGIIDLMITTHTYPRSHIESALQQVEKFQCVLFSHEMSDYAANIAAKCLVEKYRFNLVRHASMLEIAMRADEVASSLRSEGD